MGMSRPKLKSDDEILDSGARLMSELGPLGLTFQSLAREVGVSPATLVQRFGTKDAMTVSIAKHASKGFVQTFAELGATVKSPIERLVVFGGVFADLMGTPETFANSLSFFQLDLTNPELNMIARKSYRDFHGLLESTIREAIDQKLIKNTSSSALATLLHATYQGSLMNWAIYQNGSAAECMRANVEFLLKSYSK
jgi:AcrR family transcriptional regulator